MLKTSHTPGPWTIGIYDPMSECVSVSQIHESGEGRHKGIKRVAVCSQRADCDRMEVMANAMLIAAAPEMKDALNKAFDLITQHCSVSQTYHAIFDETIAQMSAAIMKASGRI